MFLKIQNAKWDLNLYVGKRIKIDSSLTIWVIVGIMTVLFISIPVSVNGMSSRPPVIPEQLEDGDYLQESYLENRKILIKDKNDNSKDIYKDLILISGKC